MLFTSTLDGTFKIHIRRNMSELVAALTLEMVMVLDYNKGYVIGYVRKLTMTKTRLSVLFEVIADCGELRSCIEPTWIPLEAEMPPL